VSHGADSVDKMGVARRWLNCEKTVTGNGARIARHRAG
jgi:hypothetical protein